MIDRVRLDPTCASGPPPGTATVVDNLLRNARVHAPGARAPRSARTSARRRDRRRGRRPRHPGRRRAGGAEAGVRGTGARGGGSGLGLYAVRAMAAQNGSLRIAGQPVGGGTRDRAELPSRTPRRKRWRADRADRRHRRGPPAARRSPAQRAVRRSGIVANVVAPARRRATCRTCVDGAPDLVLLDLDLGAFGDSTGADRAARKPAGSASLVVSGSDRRGRGSRSPSKPARSAITPKPTVSTCSSPRPSPRYAPTTRWTTRSAGYCATIWPEPAGARAALRAVRTADRSRTGHAARAEPGQSVHDIAERWVVSEATVRSHVRAVLAKLDAPSQLAAVALALHSGWLAARARTRPCELVSWASSTTRSTTRLQAWIAGAADVLRRHRAAGRRRPRQRLAEGHGRDVRSARPSTRSATSTTSAAASRRSPTCARTAGS